MNEEFRGIDRATLCWTIERLRGICRNYEKEWIMIRFFKYGRKCFGGGFEVGAGRTPLIKNWRRLHWYGWRRWALGVRAGSRRVTIDIGPLSVTIWK